MEGVAGRDWEEGGSKEEGGRNRDQRRLEGGGGQCAAGATERRGTTTTTSVACVRPCGLCDGGLQLAAESLCGDPSRQRDQRDDEDRICAGPLRCTSSPTLPAAHKKTTALQSAPLGGGGCMRGAVGWGGRGS